MRTLLLASIFVGALVAMAGLAVQAMIGLSHTGEILRSAIVLWVLCASWAAIVLYLGDEL